MLIEYIINFDLKRPVHFHRTCNSKSGYFDDKTKLSEANLRVNDYLLLKVSQEAIPCFPTRAKLLIKFTPKIRGFKRVLDLDCK